MKESIDNVDFGELFVWKNLLYVRVSVGKINCGSRNGVTCLCLEGDEKNEVVFIPFGTVVKIAEGELRWNLVERKE